MMIISGCITVTAEKQHASKLEPHEHHEDADGQLMCMPTWCGSMKKSMTVRVHGKFMVNNSSVKFIERPVMFYLHAAVRTVSEKSTLGTYNFLCPCWSATQNDLQQSGHCDSARNERQKHILRTYLGPHVYMVPHQ